MNEDAGRVVSFETVLESCSTWLNDAHGMMVALTAKSSGNAVVMRPEEAADLAKGLRIVAGNMLAMRRALDTEQPAHTSTESEQ